MNSSLVLDIFKTITTIPRESGHEGPITAYLQNWAAEHNLDCKTDSTGNILITKEASAGKEDVPTLVLQGHQDMVCEKRPGVEHDFAKDPIKYVIEDGWMIAKDTTLGADDGIGIAAALALLESDLPMGKLECLFTISEETGMDGAEALQEGFFTGKTLINLDSEDEGQLFIGCAGGLNTIITFEHSYEPLKDGYTYLKLAVGNGMGGHSGDDINKERMNALIQMTRFLNAEMQNGLQLISLLGGNKTNAIPRDCEAIIAVPEPEATIERFKIMGQDIKEEFSSSDPEIVFEAESIECESKAIESGVAHKLIASIFSCPNGVQAMSMDVPGLVETSTNLAAVKMPQEGMIQLASSQRSAIKSARRMIADKLEAHFKLAGAQVEHLYEYPGWKPNVNSHILDVCVESYKKLFNTDPEVRAIHAGLECGLFLEKFPGLDMISFGPTLRGVHAPGERMELASVDKFTELLADVVSNFK